MRLADLYEASCQTGYAKQAQNLAVLLLVTVLAETLLPLVRRDFVALALFAAGHRSRC